MRSPRRLAPGLFAVLWALGCNSLTGVSDLDPVDCLEPACSAIDGSSDDSSPVDAPANDTASVLDAADTSTAVDSSVADVVDAAEASPPVSCTELQSKLYLGHCYFIVGGTTGFANARDKCTKAGAHLATITSAGEQAAVAEVLGKTAQGAWIGLYRLVPSAPLQWITGEPVGYVSWFAGEPNASGECVRMRAGDALWGDQPCSNNELSMCERE